jgi:glycerol-3-phosphate dehydrogenase (NAD(P)+)
LCLLALNELPMTQSLQIQVVGAGAWGTALAIQAAQAGHAVTLCARSAEVAQRLPSNGSI